MKKTDYDVLVFFAEGFEEIEAIGAVDILRRGGMNVATVSIDGNRQVSGAHGVPVVADEVIADVLDCRPEWIVLPGGMPGAANLHDSEAVNRMIAAQAERGAHIAAICAAPALALAQTGMLDGRHMTCYPGFEGVCREAVVENRRSVVDGNIVTANGPSSVTNMCYEILCIAKGREVALEVLDGMLVDTDKGDFSL